MARTSLSITRLQSDGVQQSLASANADGYSLPNDGSVFLVVENTSGTDSATVTIQAQVSKDGLDLPDKDITIGSGETHLIGPFDPGVYNRGSSLSDPHTVYIDFSGTAVASLNIQAFRVP